ncbi:hypothetical protein DFH07DRAFT_221737 [Mycena maculata]|uniref:SH3 domain-containing protein n=1 Tax=Mycena maculata TaxID=230809 RepID=A0AAD7HVY3_9AGAR|nr:hypothetical protein DFH07DRAFT_221737 [Mycena maculata]
MQEDADPGQGPRLAAVLGNYFYITTVLPSVGAWLLAFGAQIAVTKIVGHSAVGVMWFAIFLQLFLTLGVLSIFASGSVAAFRLQVSTFGTMAAVFAVIGVDMSIFADEAARGAMAAGWLVLAVIDILWVLYFSAEPGTPVARLVEGMAVRDGPRAHREGDTEKQGRGSSSRMGEAGKTSFYAADAEMRSNGSPDETKVGHDNIGDPTNGGPSPELKDGAEWNQLERRIVDRSQEALAEQAQEEVQAAEPSQRDSRSPPPSAKNRRGVYIDDRRHLSTIYDNSEGTSENRDSGNLYPFKVRARSDWISRSPSEISFRKGDILHSAEKEGKKWWQVRKADGSVGTAPSNYFKVLNS